MIIKSTKDHVVDRLMGREHPSLFSNMIGAIVMITVGMRILKEVEETLK